MSSSSKRRIALNLIVNVVTQALNKLMPLVVSSLAQRRLTTPFFGQANFAIGLVDWTSPVIEAGSSSYGQVMVGAGKDDREAMGRLLGEILTLRVLNAVVAGLGLLYWVRRDYPDYASLVAAISFMLVGSTLDMTYVQNGTQRVWAVGVLTTVSKLLALAAIVALVRAPADNVVFAISVVGSNVLISIGTFVLALRSIPLRWPRWQRVAALYRTLAPFTLAVFLFYALDKYDLMIVEAHHDLGAVGLYSGASRVFLSIQALVPALALAFGSEMLSIRERGAFSQQAHFASGAAALLAFAVAVGSWFVGAELLTRLYDPSYAVVGHVFALQCASCVPQIILVVFGFYVLQKHGKILRHCVALACGVVVGAVSGLAFDRLWGLEGVALSLVVGKTVAAGLIYWWCRPFVDGGIGPFWVRSALAAAGMGLALLLLGSASLTLNLAVGGGVYVALNLWLNRSLLATIRARLQARRIAPR